MMKKVIVFTAISAVFVSILMSSISNVAETVPIGSDSIQQTILAETVPIGSDSASRLS